MIGTEGEARAYVGTRSNGAALERLDKLASMLVAENAVQNLVANGSLPHLWQRHIADSFQLIDHVPRETGVWLDLGSGAGFPGLVIALCHPGFEVHLVESRRLRIDWLKRAIDALEIRNCVVEGTDLRSLQTFQADIISARAFAPMRRLVEMSARFSTPETVWVLPKGRNAAHDVATLESPVRDMFHVKPSLTDPDAGIVVGHGKVEVAR